MKWSVALKELKDGKVLAGCEIYDYYVLYKDKVAGLASTKTDIFELSSEEMERVKSTTGWYVVGEKDNFVFPEAKFIRANNIEQSDALMEEAMELIETIRSIVKEPIKGEQNEIPDRLLEVHRHALKARNLFLEAGNLRKR